MLAFTTAERAVGSIYPLIINYWQSIKKDCDQPEPSEIESSFLSQILFLNIIKE